MVRVEDESALVNAVKDVRNDATETNWCLAGHVDNNPEVIRLAGSGTGGIEELSGSLDDGSVMYGLLRVTEKIDLSTTVKFVYVYFIGEGVPALQRGKIGTAHGEIVKYFSPYHINFEITNASEISSDIINQKIAETSGKVERVRDVTYDGSVHERGFTSSSQKASGAKKSNFGFQGQSGEAISGSAIASDSDVPSAIADVRSDKSESNWLLAAYQDNDVKKPLRLVATGQGGADELVSNLAADMIAYGFIRVIDVIEGIKTVKFAFFTYIGPDVSIMKKAKVATNKGGVSALFGSSHVSFEITSPHELSDAYLLNLIQEASGSKSKVK